MATFMVRYTDRVSLIPEFSTKEQWSRSPLVFAMYDESASSWVRPGSHGLPTAMVSASCDVELEPWFPADRAWSRKPLRSARHMVV
jgi:hypothetical protein